MNLSFQVTLQLPKNWQTQLPATQLLSDEDKMHFVIDLADWNSSSCGGGPFAAAVFDHDSHELVSIGVNRVVPDCCSLAHAEALAIALAQRKKNSFQLSEFSSLSLYSSGQPCVQCFGMFWWSGISRLVTAASAADIEELTDFNEGPLVKDWQQILRDRSGLNTVQVVEGVARDRARAVLKKYQQAGGKNYGPVSKSGTAKGGTVQEP